MAMRFVYCRTAASGAQQLVVALENNVRGSRVAEAGRAPHAMERGRCRNPTDALELMMY